MARSNSAQGSFLGGEWSQSAQGNTLDPAYKTALAACLNAYPTEEGSFMRRPGFLEMGAAYMGSPNTVSVEFSLDTGVQAYLEETLYSGHIYLRFWVNLASVFGSTFATGQFALLPDDIVAITAISTANPAVLQTPAAVTWATGDIIQIYPVNGSGGPNAPTLNGRQLKITKVDTTHFSLQDMVSGNNIDGSTLNFTASGSYAAHIAVAETNYTSANDLTGSASLSGVRIVQTGAEAFFLSANYQPYLLTLGGMITATAGQTIPFSFSFADAQFTSTSNNIWDGPYNDPLPGASQTANSTGTVTHVTSDQYTFAITDGAYSFVSNDVGRQIRIWTQPAQFNAGTSYGNGATVTYQGAFYTLTQSSVPSGTVPGQTYAISTGVYIDPWVPQPTLGGWSAGVITSVTNSTTVAVTLNRGGFNNTNTTVDTWQLGAYYPGSWPSSGTFHEGRVWLAGLSPGRFDASMANNNFLMSPTDYYGNVADNYAITYTLNTPPQSNIVWMMTDTLGVIAATGVDEWLISAPESNGAISPSNIQGRRISRYGAAPIDPIRVGLAIIFVQTQQRQLIEYLVSPFASTAPVGWRLNVKAKHLTADGDTPRAIIGVTYQEEPTPILWVTRADSSLIGCTYRRQNTFGSEPPTFMGWHRHTYGFAPSDPGLGKSITSGAAGSQVGFSTQDGTVGYFDVLAPAFSENSPPYQAGFVDGSPGGYMTGIEVIPSNSQAVYLDGHTVVKLPDLSSVIGNITEFTLNMWVRVTDVTTPSIVSPFVPNNNNPVFQSSKPAQAGGRFIVGAAGYISASGDYYHGAINPQDTWNLFDNMQIGVGFGPSGGGYGYNQPSGGGSFDLSLPAATPWVNLMLSVQAGANGWDVRWWFNGVPTFHLMPTTLKGDQQVDGSFLAPTTLSISELVNGSNDGTVNTYWGFGLSSTSEPWDGSSLTDASQGSVANVWLGPYTTDPSPFVTINANGVPIPTNGASWTPPAGSWLLMKGGPSAFVPAGGSVVTGTGGLIAVPGPAAYG